MQYDVKMLLSTITFALYTTSTVLAFSVPSPNKVNNLWKEESVHFGTFLPLSASSSCSFYNDSCFNKRYVRNDKKLGRKGVFPLSLSYQSNNHGGSQGDGGKDELDGSNVIKVEKQGCKGDEIHLLQALEKDVELVLNNITAAEDTSVYPCEFLFLQDDHMKNEF